MLRALIALCLILVASTALAKQEQVKPDTDIVTDRKPITIQDTTVPCLRQEPVTFKWLLRDEHGNLIVVSGRAIRMMC